MSQKQAELSAPKSVPAVLLLLENGGSGPYREHFFLSELTQISWIGLPTSSILPRELNE